MTVLATAKSKLNGNVKEAFKNEDGAIDLASIMVGIIVIGIIGGVIAATVFAVIPWAQDNGAKQQLDSVASAESAYIGLSTDGGSGSFGDFSQLSTGTNVLLPATTKVKVVVSGTSASTAHYAAAIKSASGNFFYISDTKTQATKSATDPITSATPGATTVTYTLAGVTSAAGYTNAQLNSTAY